MMYAKLLHSEKALLLYPSFTNRRTETLSLNSEIFNPSLIYACFVNIGDESGEKFLQSIHEFANNVVYIIQDIQHLYFINANSASAPGIVDADRQPILERSEVYSGVYGRASINFYAFNSNGNKGIACGLNNLQKIADGEPLGGKSRAEDDFATDDDDDFLS